MEYNSKNYESLYCTPLTYNIVHQPKLSKKKKNKNKVKKVHSEFFSFFFKLEYIIGYVIKYMIQYQRVPSHCKMYEEGPQRLKTYNWNNYICHSDQLLKIIKQ